MGPTPSNLTGEPERATQPDSEPGTSRPRTDQPRPSPELGRGGPDVEGLLREAEAALASVSQVEEAADVRAVAFELQDFASAAPYSELPTLPTAANAELDLKIELGRTQMRLADLLELRKGSVVPLDKAVGELADIYVGGRLVAHGEVLVLDDSYCVRIAALVNAAGEASR